MPHTGDRTAFEEAEERFARELLPFPPLPERFTGRLRPFGTDVFTTRELDHGPYAMGVLVAEILDGGPVPEYATIGFDGYGIQSWAVHHILVQRGLALFLQFAWGGAQLDEDAARRTVTEGFSFANSLQGAIERALIQGRVSADDRLVVNISSFGGSGWGWVRAGTEESAWQDEQDVVGGVTQAVAALFAGTG